MPQATEENRRRRRAACSRSAAGRARARRRHSVLGTDHDIAFSERDGNAWTATGFLTASTEDELDPRVVVESDGTVHVVWWTAGTTEKVYLSTRAAGSGVCDTPVLVTGMGEEGRRPAVAVDAEGLRIAFERDSALPGLAQDVVAATKQPGGGFFFEVVRALGRPVLVGVESVRKRIRNQVLGSP